jgi:outer membrane protein OmpA-like peptidoglycan-associated protein
MSGCPKFFVLLALASGLTGIAPATAQQIIGGIGEPNVVVDYGVIEQLGPPPNIPRLVLRNTGRPLAIQPRRTRPGALQIPLPRFPVISNGVQAAEQKRIVLKPPGTWKKSRVKRKHRKMTRKSVTPVPARKTTQKGASSTVPPMPKVAALPKVAPPLSVIKKTPLPAPPKPPQTARVPSVPVALTPTAVAPPPPPPIAMAPPVASLPAAIAPPPRVPAMSMDPKPVKPPQKVAKAVAKPQKPKPRAIGAGSSIRIMFSAGSAKLDEGASANLKRIAVALNADTTLRVQLEAYADAAQGSTSQARRLSLSRALAARSYLIGKKVRSTRIDVRALGNKSGGEAADRIDIVVTNR